MSQAVEKGTDVAFTFVEEETGAMAGVLHGVALSMLIYALGIAGWWLW
ncbi:MAG: hypothetical protein RIC56_02785 [Pseudomonadales bacterium]